MVGEHRRHKACTSGVEMNRIVAFAFVGFVLVTASDFPETASLAVAFAYLILLSALMTVGPVAFGRITDLITQSTTAGGNEL